jgi:hypothetical protein
MNRVYACGLEEKSETKDPSHHLELREQVSIGWIKFQNDAKNYNTTDVAFLSPEKA